MRNIDNLLYEVSVPQPPYTQGRHEESYRHTFNSFLSHTYENQKIFSIGIIGIAALVQHAGQDTRSRRRQDEPVYR